MFALNASQRKENEEEGDSQVRLFGPITFTEDNLIGSH